jgi:hypothetical protein
MALSTSVPLDFSRLDMADGAARPPVVQHEIGARCLCGRRLMDCVYTFLPTATFIAGQCPVCEGVQTAIFAPAMEQTAPQELLNRFLAFLAYSEGVEETLSSGPEGRGEVE